MTHQTRLCLSAAVAAVLGVTFTSFGLQNAERVAQDVATTMPQNVDQNDRPAEARDPDRVVVDRGNITDLEPNQPSESMQAVLDAHAALEPEPLTTLSPEDARDQPSMADALERVIDQRDLVLPDDMLESVDDRSIDGPGEQDIGLRVYRPEGDGPFPAIVYYHGGGFVIATIDTYDASARALAKQARAVVISVEYRKAPEHKYPAAVDDAFAAYKWVAQNAAEIDVDPTRIAVAGESAGGNLATVTAMRAREESIPAPIFQLLIYPVVNNDMTTPSYQEYANAKPLDKASMQWFFQHYLADPSSAGEPHVSPLKASPDLLSQMPPTMIITAEIDPLRSEGEQYAQALQAAGVPVIYKNYPHVTHEFFGLAGAVETAGFAQADAGKALREVFDRDGKTIEGDAARRQPQGQSR